MACYHRLWAAHTVERHRAWHAIIACGKHTELNDIGRSMPSSPLDGKHCQTTSGVAYHHCLWAAQAVGRRQALHSIIAFGQHTQSNDVGRGMTSSPLGSTQDRIMSGVECHHRLWQHTRSDDVGRGMTSPPLDNTHGRQCRAWHDDITTLGNNTWSGTWSVA